MNTLRVVPMLLFGLYLFAIQSVATAVAQPAAAQSPIDGKVCSGEFQGYLNRVPLRLLYWFGTAHGGVDVWVRILPMDDHSNIPPLPPERDVDHASETLASYDGGWIGFTSPSRGTQIFVNPGSFDPSRQTVDARTSRMQAGEVHKFVCVPFNKAS